MAEREQRGSSGASPADQLAAGEHEQLVYAVETRFAPHAEAAAAVVREAERELVDAQEALARAEAAESEDHYTSDPLVFMRASVREEVEGLSRKTTPKKARASYRFLIDRAVELAAAEVQGFHDDRASERRDREQGLAASRDRVTRAEAALSEAHAMQELVTSAESSVRQGLSILVEKLTGPAEP